MDNQCQDHHHLHHQNNGLFSNSLTLSEIAGGFSGSVCFFEDDTNVPYNLLGSASYVLFFKMTDFMKIFLLRV
jgi:hypothetical protein